jgi:hypothetical protein
VADADRILPLPRLSVIDDLHATGPLTRARGEVGRVYLGAFARGLGATASTFYDDDVTALLAPEERLSPMLAVAVGLRA